MHATVTATGRSATDPGWRIGRATQPHLFHCASTRPRPAQTTVAPVHSPDEVCEHGAMVESSSPGVRISLLGGVRIEVSGAEPLDPLPRKCQELLAALALAPGSSITVGRLVGLIWGEEPPRTAEKTLQTYVARLRRELGPATIARTGSAYRLDVEPAAIDTSRFREALEQGNTAAALREWTGAPLAGVDTTGLRPLLDALTEEWLDAVELDLEEVVNTQPGTAIGRLTELVAAHPFREGLWALLMTALYRTDRQAEALDAFRRARTTLVEELGVEPGLRLRDLEQLVLQQDERLDGEHDHRRRRRSERVAPTGTVTFGFAELAGIGALWTDHPSEAADVVALFVGTVTAIAQDHQGAVFTSGTESAGVAFDSARNATRWATHVHESVEAINWPHAQPVGVRIGLHTGEADERDGTYYGPVVSLAHRLAAIGAPGQTIATAMTATLGDTDHVQLGTFAIDGASQEHDLHQIGPGSHPSLRLSMHAIDRVPKPTHQLIGREPLVAHVAESLTRAQLVTLVGPGGIGKTRLAIEVVRRHGPAPARTWFVSLAEVSEPSDATRALADSIGVRESSEQSLTGAIVAALNTRPSFVLLDNCEHVVDGVSTLVSDLLTSCPELSVLATSREGLGVPAEQLVPVGPLDAENAGVDLFIERALSADPDIDLNRTAVTAVCRRLDGVPLAIELAAARARTITPQDLLERLDDSFRVLTGSRRRTLERHRTLRATMQWSYELLTESEQLLFRRLAVFSGSFDLRAAEQVVGDDELRAADVGALVSDLVDRSMCLVESGTSGRRFRLLEPMRQFGLEELHADGPDTGLRRRHAEHVRQRVMKVHHLLAGQREIEGAAELAELWPNLRIAVDWAIDHGDARLAHELVAPIAAQGFLRNGLGELGDWIGRIVDIAHPDDHDAIGSGLLWTALYAQLTEDRSNFDRLCERVGSSDTAFALLAGAIIDNDSPAVLEHVADARDEAERQGDSILACLIEILNDGNLVQVGRVDEAETHVVSGITSGASSVPPTLVTWMLYMAATLRSIKGDRAGASELFDRIATIVLPPRTNSPTASLAARRAALDGDHLGAYAILREHIDDLIAGNNLNGALVVAAEFANLLITTDNLGGAANVLGQLDACGIGEIGGFNSVLTEVRAEVDRDETASAMLTECSLQPTTASDLLHSMAATLDALLTA